MASKSPLQLTSLFRHLRPTSQVFPTSSLRLRGTLQPQNHLPTLTLRPLSHIRQFHGTSSTLYAEKLPEPETTPADRSIPVPFSRPEYRRQGGKPIPQYSIVFTCRPCGHRSSHRITKQGYHHGTVLIQCPECKNRHIISDHFKIFSDLNVTIEDILKARGEEVVRGSLTDEGGSVEWFQGDGIRVARRPPFVPKPRKKRGEKAAEEEAVEEDVEEE